MTNLRKSITGTYDRETLATLRAPVAWSGTVDPDDRERQELDRGNLAFEILETLDDPDVVAVRVEAGEIVELIGA